MTKLEKIEASIGTLNQDEFWQLAEWFADRQAERWDQQIDDDAKAGRLDDLIAEARAEIALGKVNPF